MTSPINLFLGINLLHYRYLIAPRRARGIIPSRPSRGVPSALENPEPGIPFNKFRGWQVDRCPMGLVTLGQLEKLRSSHHALWQSNSACWKNLESPHSIDFRNPNKGHMSPLLRKADDQCAHVVSGCGNNGKGKGRYGQRRKWDHHGMAEARHDEGPF